MRRFFSRLATLFRSSRAESELSREINAHLQLLEDQFVAKGMSRVEARYAAKRAFGGVEQAKELQRDARSFRWLAGWPMDLKLGVRMLIKTPGLTAVGVIALAVAIGAGAAYLEFTRDLLHPRLDVPGADRLVGIKAWNAERRLDETFVIKDFATWRANTTQLEDLGAARGIGRDLTTPDGLTASVRGVEISASAFRLIPAPPLMGRALRDEDERPDAPNVAVIGHKVWVHRFHTRSDVLGLTARFGSTDYTVVGVMPDGFAFPINNDLWVPLKRPFPLSEVFARLKDGATSESAQAELRGMTAQSAELRLRPAIQIHVKPYLDSMLDQDRGSVEIMVIRALNLIFIMLLGICGANVATLVFARTAMREGEITVRTALGASRGRISAQLFAEALVLSLVAAVAGLFTARRVGVWTRGLFEQGIAPAPFWWDDGLGLPTILYAFALAIFAALIVGVIPALKATGARLHARLRDAASGTATMKFGGLWTSVIVTQAALTVAFISAVVGLGLGVFYKNANEDVRYPREQLLTARVLVDDGSGRATPPDNEVRTAIAERLRREPGVMQAGYTTAMPGTIFEQFEYEFQSPELQAYAVGAQTADDFWSVGAGVTTGFFEAAGLALISGRTFTDADIRQNAAFAMVDETFVRVVLGGRNPIGVRLRRRADGNAAAGPWSEIIGVVSDATVTKDPGVEDAVVYRPAPPGEPVRLLVRTRGAAAAMTQQIYAAVRSENADVRLADLKSLAQQAYDDDLPARIFLRTFIVISAIALLLATAGIYALISFTLARRTREIGIRIALGAAPRGIIRGVFARAFTQIGLGLAAGALPALVIIDGIAGDATSISLPKAIAMVLGICAFVVAVALASCAVPLRRALRVDPIKALRAE